jgi:excisionase family DNA binding protein
MSKPVPIAPAVNPFDLLIEQIRTVVREEVAAALSGNGHAKPLTAEELARQLQMSEATIYKLAKSGEIPYLKVGRCFRFNLQAVLDSQKKNNKPLDEL